jgi:peroxiredoxin
MRQLRYWIPVLCSLALTVLFLKMPEAPSVFGIFKCKTCVTSDPYLPMIGGVYFAILFAISMLFPTFPGPLIARGGLIWALLLFLAFTFIDLPNWCVACIFGHICNILIWAIWWLVPPIANEIRSSPFSERLFLTFFAPISIVALFSCLNLTFMVYNLKAKHNVLMTSLQSGDILPSFTARNDKNRSFTNADIAATTRSFINFVSPNCPYCTQQLSILDDVAVQLANGSYRFINISPSLTQDLVEQSSTTEWFEDKEGKLRELFRVSGYPTLFVVGADGKILEVIAGVSKDLNSILLNVQVQGSSSKKR